MWPPSNSPGVRTSKIFTALGPASRLVNEAALIASPDSRAGVRLGVVVTKSSPPDALIGGAANAA
jgi:hypothetical protein